MIFPRLLTDLAVRSLPLRIRWMVEFGLLNRWLYSQYDGLDLCASMAKSGDQTSALDIGEIQSVFWVWIIGLGLSLISILSETLRRFK